MFAFEWVSTIAGGFGAISGVTGLLVHRRVGRVNDDTRPIGSGRRALAKAAVAEVVLDALGWAVRHRPRHASVFQQIADKLCDELGVAHVRLVEPVARAAGRRTDEAGTTRRISADADP